VRVLHLGKFYPPHRGGIESHLQTLCEGLATSLAVEVVVANGSPRDVTDMINGVSVRRLAQRALLSSAPICPSLINYLRQSPADLIHLHTPNPFAMLALLLSGNRAPLVISWHSDIVRQRLAYRVFAPIERALLRRAVAIITSSAEYLASSPVLRDFRERCVVIPYGICPRDFVSPDSTKVAHARVNYGSRIVLAVGRFVYYKGFADLIRAMRTVDAMLLLAGAGPLLRRLERVAEAAGVVDKVVFLGELAPADLIACYHAADLFVLPAIARSEAFGIVQVEAMAAGLPVVNTSIDSGVPAVSLDGLTGITVAPRAPDSLASAINRLLSDPALRARYGDSGRRRVREHFDAATMVARTLVLYQRVLEH